MPKIDFSGPTRFNKKATKKSLRLANKYRKWARKQNRRNWQANKPVIENMQTLMNEQLETAGRTGDRYEQIFEPYEEEHMENIRGFQGKVDAFSDEVDKLKADAEAYKSEANREFMIGRAQAKVGDAFEKSRQGALETLESRGINPAATRYAAMDYGVRTAEAAAKAAAGTQAGLDVDETSRAMFQDALTREAQARGLDLSVLGLEKGMVDYGGTLPGRELAQQTGALASGTGAVGSQLATSELALKHKTGMNDFMRTLNESIAGWSDTLNKQYGAEAAERELDLKEQELEAAESSGIGGIVGAVMPFVQNFMAEGGPVTPDMSPSGGAIEDDVPAMVSANEFVFPEAAVRFYGTDKLQKMITRAQGVATGGTGGEMPGASAEPAIPETTMGFEAMRPTPMGAVPPAII